jgi:hypothetical protein
MGIITIAVDDKIEKKFRMHVAHRYGRGKGTLGKAVTQAMEEWTQKDKSLDKFMKLLEEGRHFGKWKFKTRDDIHDRR